MVAHLVAARATGEPMELLTGRFGRMSIEQAYEVQDGLTEVIAGSGDPVAGYKIGLADKGAREAWGLDEPAYGRLHKSMAVADGGSVSLADYNAFGMEVEVAFVMARRVDRPIKDVAELRPYVRSVHPAFDLASNRFRAEGGPRKVADVIADDVASNRFVLGPAAEPGKLELDKLTLSGTHDGRQVYVGASSNVMGDPWKALRWLANALRRRGLALEAGDVVLSGDQGVLPEARSGGGQIRRRLRAARSRHLRSPRRPEVAVRPAGGLCRRTCLASPARRATHRLRQVVSPLKGLLWSGDLNPPLTRWAEMCRPPGYRAREHGDGR